MSRAHDVVAAVARGLAGEAEGPDLPLEPLEPIEREVEAIVGGLPEPPAVTDKPVAVVRWVDGTVLDTVWQAVESGSGCRHCISGGRRL